MIDFSLMSYTSGREAKLNFRHSGTLLFFTISLNVKYLKQRPIRHENLIILQHLRFLKREQC